MPARQLFDDAVAIAFVVLLLLLFLEVGPVQWSHANQAAVGQQNLQLNYMINGFAIHHGMRARRIVGDHAADGRAIGGRNIRRELQIGSLNLYIEILQHATGLNAHPAIGAVHFQDLLEILGEIDDDSRPNALARLRSAPAARG